MYSYKKLTQKIMCEKLRGRVKFDHLPVIAVRLKEHKMVDYKKSFEIGQKNLETAQKNRKEIDSVFTELNHQLYDVTDGKISIRPTEFIVKGSSVMQTLLSEPKTYHGLGVFHNHHDLEPVELVKWYQEPTGYPCKITTQHNDLICEDKEELESTLAALLAIPYIAGKLQELIQYKSPTT